MQVSLQNSGSHFDQMQTKAIDEFCVRMRTLLAQNQIEEVLEASQALFKQTIYIDKINAQVKAYQQFQEIINQESLVPHEVSQKRTAIRVALLKILKEVQQEAPLRVKKPTPSPETKPTSKSFSQILAGFIVAIIIIGGLIGIYRMVTDYLTATHLESTQVKEVASMQAEIEDLLKK